MNEIKLLKSKKIIINFHGQQTSDVKQASHFQNLFESKKLFRVSRETLLSNLLSQIVPN